MWHVLFAFIYFFARFKHTHTHIHRVKQSFENVEKPVRNQHALFIVDFSFIASFILFFRFFERKILGKIIISLFFLALLAIARENNI